MKTMNPIENLGRSSAEQGLCFDRFDVQLPTVCIKTYLRRLY